MIAYACAAVAAVVLIALIGVIEGDGKIVDLVDLFKDLRGTGPMVLVVAIYALPVALPVVIATEIRKNGSWKIFLGAGAVLGLLLTLLFTEDPFGWSSLRFSAIFLPVSMVAACVYWLVAWSRTSPAPRRPSEISGAPL